MCGLLDVRLVKRTTDGDTFYSFVEKSLLPHLLPFDGSNPHSVVIMHNCFIHHIGEVVKMIEEVGAIVHFLPPYSPDFMPIELAFSKVKTSLWYRRCSRRGNCIVGSVCNYYTTRWPRLDFGEWVVLLIFLYQLYLSNI